MAGNTENRFEARFPFDCAGNAVNKLKVALELNAWPRFDCVPAPRFTLRAMAQHPTNCEICARIEGIKNSAHPGFICELPTGFFVLGDSQQWRGYALLLCKTPVADLEELPWPARLEFLRDLALCSEAVANVIHPHKMNVESLGNAVPHLHFHLFPRYLTEEEPTKPVWLQTNPTEETALDSQRDSELLSQLRSEIERLLQARLT
jgi:diadenosine tetraphosphate (Ap4A) HIT family hydrolase